MLLFVFEIGFLFPAEESDIKHPALQVLCERHRVIARNPDFDIEQFAVCSGGAAFHICKACRSAYKVFFKGARGTHI